MLEAGRVGRVARNGDVDLFHDHDRNALVHVVRAVAAHLRALTRGVGGLFHDRHFARVVVVLGLHIGEPVDARNNIRRVLAQAV